MNQLNFIKDSVFFRECNICHRIIPTNIIEKKYICCDCRKKKIIGEKNHENTPHKRQ